MKPTARLAASVLLSVWVALVQPGLSYFWLIDPHVHVEIDAEEYGQTPDGQTLPGHPWHLPHDHPSSAGLSISDLVQQNFFDTAFYARVFSPAVRPSLQGHRPEVDVVAAGVYIPPPDQPPRA